MSEIRKWADEAMFEAEPHPQYDPESGVIPKVTLISMSHDPLGEVATFNGIYKGEILTLADVTDDMRKQALEDVQQTHLQAPLETIKLHFLFDGVDRSFTHQNVRQRTAVYAQESLRFAVVRNLRQGTSLPPSLANQRSDSPQRQIWDNTLDTIGAAYEALIESGIPAEDARGLLPHATATRIHYVTDMRNLKEHAGNRLCTQAQFHWRYVFSQIVQEVHDYGRNNNLPHEWQFPALARSPLFRPVCYQLGRCPFKASFDRHCEIRETVDTLEQNGVPTSHWEEHINSAQWLLNPESARRQS